MEVLHRREGFKIDAELTPDIKVRTLRQGECCGDFENLTERSCLYLHLYIFVFM